MTWQVIQDQLSLDMVPLVAQCDCGGPGGWQGVNFLACTLKQTQARVCGADCKRLQFLSAAIDFFSNTAVFPGI